MRLEDLKAGAIGYQCVTDGSSKAGVIIQRIRILEVIKQGLSPKGNPRLPRYRVAVDYTLFGTKKTEETVVGPKSRLFSWFTRLSAVESVNCALAMLFSDLEERSERQQNEDREFLLKVMEFQANELGIDKDNLPHFIKKLQGFKRLYEEAQKVDDNLSYYDDWLNRGLIL